jgi:hypothetical protein
MDRHNVTPFKGNDNRGIKKRQANKQEKIKTFTIKKQIKERRRVII